MKIDPEKQAFQTLSFLMLDFNLLETTDSQIIADWANSMEINEEWAMPSNYSRNLGNKSRNELVIHSGF